jgi:hypothetical protein
LLRSTVCIIFNSMFVQSTPITTAPSWWLDHIAVPVAFTLLGAVLGFVAARLNVWWDSKAQTKNFLKGISSELQSLKSDLQNIKALADETCAEYADPQKRKDVVHFVNILGMTFFKTQVGKLPEISDKRIFEIIRLYNDMSGVQSFCDRLNSMSFELVHEGADFDSPKAQNYFGGMQHLSKTIQEVSMGLDNVLRKIQ